MVTEFWLTVRPPNRRTLTVMVDGPLVVGRDCDGLLLADPRVSRRHTSFEPVDDKLLITDLGSSNGTLVNGEAVPDPTPAADGDVVTVGATLISIRIREPSTDSLGAIPTELLTSPGPSVKTSIELVAEAVERETGTGTNAEVIGVEREPGTLTVVFSDIEASTELALAMGDARWFEVLAHHHRLVTAHVDAHQGRVVKNQGDGYMLCFRSARQAMLAMIGLQRDLARQPDQDSETLRVRIGAHTGEVMMQDDGDLFGKHVILAARIGALAGGGKLLVSNLSKQIAEPRGDIAFGPAVEVQLKGLDATTVVHEVDWAAYEPKVSAGAGEPVQPGEQAGHE